MWTGMGIYTSWNLIGQGMMGLGMPPDQVIKAPGMLLVTDQYWEFNWTLERR